MFKNALFSKMMMMGVLMLLLLVPLTMIESKISERQHLQAEVQQEIARTASGPQTLEGPYLVLQYRLREISHITDEAGLERVKISESAVKEQVFAPHQLTVVGDSKVETRQRGIYQARLFSWHSQLQGQFQIPVAYGLNKPLADIIPVAAYFVVKVSDSRGIRNVPRLTLNNQPFEFSPGTAAGVSGNGIHVALKALSAEQPYSFKFSFPLELQGTSRLAIAPVANQTEVSLKSDWLHPSFGGSYLPRTRELTQHGFQAQWLVSNLSRNSAGEDGKEVFSVDFIDPINIYLMSERAVKYGVLFVVLIFTAFFMFEMLRNLRIHPMQYLLVGLAQAMFFLLMISLSEHMLFWSAYLVSGLACVVLIGVYLVGVLRAYKPAATFGLGISLMYLVLYGVLQSEDNALLTGSLLMFGALASVMLLTRNLDWYQLNLKPNNEPNS